MGDSGFVVIHFPATVDIMTKPPLQTLVLAGLLLMVHFRSKASVLDTVITVRTVSEFFSAMGSNRTLILEGKDFYFDTTAPALDYTGIENLEIRCTGEKPVNFFQQDPWADVLAFRNCTNIRLSNLSMGHYETEGMCGADVLVLDHCTNVHIKDCWLFGTGQIGINGYFVQNLLGERITVYDCSLHLLYFDYCNNLRFEDSQFKQATTEYAPFHFFECKTALFDSCRFQNLTVAETEMHYDDVFEAYGSHAILIRNGNFHRIEAHAMRSKSVVEMVQMEGCTFFKCPADE
jgi:hypothetical protein